MIYRKLGNCGLKVSILGIGGWATFGSLINDIELGKQIIYKAYELGINHFDIADVYELGNAEIFMGKIFKIFKRHELVISSKVYGEMSSSINDKGLSRKHIKESIEQSLKRLGMDYLDIYYCHGFDENTPLEETIRAMDDLVREGKILYWATSNWQPEQIKKAFKLCSERGFYKPQVEQSQYNLLFRKQFEKKILPITSRLGMGNVIWGALASGILTGKYDNGIPENSRFDKIKWLKDKVPLYTQENINRVILFGKLLKNFEITRAQLCLSWIIRNSNISSIIIGATNLQQLEENIKSINFNIDNKLLKEINNLFGNH